MQSIPQPSQQQGVVLIVALIILLAMTLVGVTSMNTASLEERMAANTRDRHVAFQAAEATLREGERYVEGNPMNPASFNDSCTNGLCDCSPTSYSGTTACPEYWTDSSLDVWNTSSKHRTYASPFPDADQAGKYIVEFVGYVCPGTTACVPGAGDPQMFRITAVGYGQSANSLVMLQSTYKKD